MSSRLPVLLTLLLVAVPSSAHGQQVGQFRVRIARDVIDDGNRSHITTPALPESSYDDMGFGAKCMADGLNIIVLFGKYLGGNANDEVEVRVRFDNEPAGSVVEWPLLQGQESAYLPMSRVRTFVERARTSNRIAIRVVDPLDGETLTAVFSLSGFSEALRRILPCDV